MPANVPSTDFMSNVEAAGVAGVVGAGVVTSVVGFGSTGSTGFCSFWQPIAAKQRQNAIILVFIKFTSFSL
jgi:hypothetical protein